MRRRWLTWCFIVAVSGCGDDCGQRSRRTPEAPLKTREEGISQESPPPSELPPPSDLLEPPADALRSTSGLVSRVLVPGQGERPRPFDLVRMHYTAWTPDGKVFDSTHKRGVPAEVPLDQTLAGFTEGISTMQVGETRRLWIPAKLAYAGQKGFPQQTLVFDIELLSFEKRPEPPPVPTDLSQPPRSALKSKSGLVSVVVKRGAGREHPGTDDLVTVHYNGFSSDGKLFDSTKKRGAPATFPLSRVIEGLREGIALMVVGEKRKLWVPPSLGYAGKEGPQGVLFYEVELLAIRKGPPSAKNEEAKSTSQDPTPEAPAIQP